MDKFFFCFGLPKSGTTFLQRTLDLHPQISCPSEHNLAFLVPKLRKVFSEYNRLLTVVDNGTGGQGAKLVDAPAFRKILRASILVVAESAGRGKPICGLSDNSVVNRLNFYSELLDHPPMICIFRNPIDRGMSAWRHNHRLAKKHNNPVHLELMSKHGGTLEGWLKFCAERFTNMVKIFAQFSETHHNAILVRYEELVKNKAVELCRLFKELGGDTSPEVIDTIVRDSSLKRMSKSSAHPDFFGAGDTDLGGSKISEELRAEILTNCAAALKDAGYST